MQKRIRITTPRWALPLLAPARYKGISGGRASGKSHFFAETMVDDCVRDRNLSCVCIREVQKSLKFSAKRLIENKIESLGVADCFEIQNDQIKRKGGRGVIIFQGMADHTADSIKSLEEFRRAWVEEAQNLSERSMMLLRPTIRAEGSELWFSWNPDLPDDPVDKFFASNPEGAIHVKVNYDENPFKTDTIMQEIELDKKMRSEDDFNHIWLGQYRKYLVGTYYGQEMTDAADRITSVPYNPACEVHTAWDLGYGDTTAIWFFQIVGKEPRCIDYLEENGKGLDYYIQELKKKPYNYGTHVMPHDAGHGSLRTGKTLKAQCEDLGLKNIVVLPRDEIDPGIQLTRQLLKQMWFDRTKCFDGVDRLKKYRRKWNEERRCFSDTPLHDYTSNGADAMRYLAVWMATRYKGIVQQPKPQFSHADIYGRAEAGTAWMG